MRLKTLAAAMAVGLTLGACGGGGGAGSSVDGGTLTGVLTDSYVKGVTYTAAPSGKSGTTDVNGNFDYVVPDRNTIKHILINML
jgi:ABC-type glycerol-3-phosphate transport system substrate-binding protein